MDRREFLQKFGAGSAAVALSACGGSPDAGRYTEADIALLAAQRAAEAAQSGRGPFGVHRYQGYRGLAELPWFDLDAQGGLICVDDSLPKAIDVHCHLGMSYLFRPTLDLQAATARVKHLLDCDAEQPGCDLDLDVYINSNFTEAGLDQLQKSTLAQGLWGSSFARTQTIPNLLSEMDAMRVEQAFILPIKLGLPFGDNLSEHWLAEIDKAGAGQRLKAGWSVHPRDDDRLAQIRAGAAAGCKVLKLHPTVQRFYPDDESMMAVYELAEELGLTIFFHGGRAGIEPEASHPYAMPRHYQGAIANFPKLNFVLLHAGARDFEAMLELAVSHDNAWLGIHGQSLTNLDTMIRRTGGERLLFGSDWPFYHLGASLAKVLITTDSPARRNIRSAILRDNAEALFA
ncbi:MAG: amidohydrolase family protein [Gammaproteobacteria bacterium]|nr:amidohydrolase family protein [Gammaproteobacteria bacterium]